MVWVVLIFGATLLLAYANGANDNFKGVATLFGSRTASFSVALRWATFTTLLGSLTACFLATKLIKAFSGKGLVPDGVIENPVFIGSVVLGAGITVLVAARFGVPISTTHSLTGALVGSGWMAVGTSLHWHSLWKTFLIPLLSSPFIAIVLTAGLYLIFRWGRRQAKINRETCLCVGEKTVPVSHLGVEPGGSLSLSQIRSLDVMVDEEKVCEAKAIQTYQGRVFGINAQVLLDSLHFLSAGAVSFARGLNDTPKIVGISLAVGALALEWKVGLVAVAMAVGGFLGARRVAETVSHRITAMNHGQGFTGNLVTAALVIVASNFGVPVSTTHVSCGSLFGIGLVNGSARWNVVGGIVSAWVLTLPIACGLAALSYGLLQRIGV